MEISLDQTKEDHFQKVCFEQCDKKDVKTDDITIGTDQNRILKKIFIKNVKK